jgi:hypothetical protein
MGLHDPFGYLKHKLWPKKGLGVLTPDHLKLRIALIPLHASGVPHIVGKLLMRGYNFAWYFTSIGGLHIKLWDPKVTGIPILGISGFPFGVLRQNDIWVLVLWPRTEYTIKGKVVASPKSRPWWILWVCVCPWLVPTPKVFQLCINQLVVWFV